MAKSKHRSKHRKRGDKNNLSYEPTCDQDVTAQAPPQASIYSSSVTSTATPKSRSADTLSKPRSSFDSIRNNEGRQSLRVDTRDTIFNPLWKHPSRASELRMHSLHRRWWILRPRSWWPCRTFRWICDFIAAFTRVYWGPYQTDLLLSFFLAAVSLFAAYVAFEILLSMFLFGAAQGIDDNCSIVYVTIPGPIITVSLIGAIPSNPARGTYYFSVINGTTQWLDSIAPPTQFSTLITRTPGIASATESPLSNIRITTVSTLTMTLTTRLPGELSITHSLLSQPLFFSVSSGELATTSLGLSKPINQPQRPWPSPILSPSTLINSTALPPVVVTSNIPYLPPATHSTSTPSGVSGDPSVALPASTSDTYRAIPSNEPTTLNPYTVSSLSISSTTTVLRSSMILTSTLGLIMDSSLPVYSLSSTAFTSSSTLDTSVITSSELMIYSNSMSTRPLSETPSENISRSSFPENPSFSLTSSGTISSRLTETIVSTSTVVVNPPHIPSTSLKSLVVPSVSSLSTMIASSLVGEELKTMTSISLTPVGRTTGLPTPLLSMSPYTSFSRVSITTTADDNSTVSQSDFPVPNAPSVTSLSNGSTPTAMQSYSEPIRTPISASLTHDMYSRTTTISTVTSLSRPMLPTPSNRTPFSSSSFATISRSLPSKTSSPVSSLIIPSTALRSSSWAAPEPPGFVSPSRNADSTLLSSSVSGLSKISSKAINTLNSTTTLASSTLNEVSQTLLRSLRSSSNASEATLIVPTTTISPWNIGTSSTSRSATITEVSLSTSFRGSDVQSTPEKLPSVTSFLTTWSPVSQTGLMSFIFPWTQNSSLKPTFPFSNSSISVTVASSLNGTSTLSRTVQSSSFQTLLGFSSQSMNTDSLATSSNIISTPLPVSQSLSNMSSLHSVTGFMSVQTETTLIRSVLSTMVSNSSMTVATSTITLIVSQTSLTESMAISITSSQSTSASLNSQPPIASSISRSMNLLSVTLSPQPSTTFTTTTLAISTVSPTIASDVSGWSSILVSLDDTTRATTSMTARLTESVTTIPSAPPSSFSLASMPPDTQSSTMTWASTALSQVTNLPTPESNTTLLFQARGLTTKIILYGDTAISFTFPTPEIKTTVSFWSGEYPTVTGPLPSDLQTLVPTTRTLRRTLLLENPSVVLSASTRRSLLVTVITTVLLEDEEARPALGRRADSSGTTITQDSTLGVGQTAVMTTDAAQPKPSWCGEAGNFTLTFDDTVVGGDDSVPLVANGMKNPYHHLFYANGFTYVPDKWEPFPAVSQPNVAMFLPLTGRLFPNTPFAGTLLPGELGAGPRASVDAYWFNAYSGFFGCALNGVTPCILRISGYRYDAQLKDEVLVVEQNVTIPACWGYINCQLTQVLFNDGFHALSGIQFNAYTYGLGIPQVHMMDDLHMEWYNNSCSAGILRMGHR